MGWAVVQAHRRRIAIAVLAALALVVTGIAVAKSDDWTGERRYTFTQTTTDLAPQTMPAGSAPARFEWPAPANATAMTVNVTVTFSGQAAQGGSAVVRIRVVAPDGTNLPSTTKAMSIGAGQTSASLTLEHAVAWAQAPPDVRDTRPPEGIAWTGPLQLFITVDRPADLPLASYAFTANVTGTVTSFAA